MTDNSIKKEPEWIRFVAGGSASCTAEFFTLPIDTVKVRLQIQNKSQRVYNGMFDAFLKIPKQEGFTSLWKGLTPALLRQASYSSIRMGVYEPIRNIFTNGKDASEAKFWQRLMAGGTAGSVGIAIANPTELVKIRMQADKAGTRYNGVIHAFRVILQTEGVQGFWTGVLPNVQRAFVVNAVELATYDYMKSFFVNKLNMNAEKPTTHFIASFVTGFAAACASSPIDVIKNRLMSQSAEEKAYKGMLDCGVKIVKNEGALSLYNGFIPLWLRLGPWCIIMFMSYEQYRTSLNKLF